MGIDQMTGRRGSAPSGLSPIASLVGVTKAYGDAVALDDVSLAFAPGEIVGLLGPNGAGKTTLVSLLQGLRAPSSGSVRLFGNDPRLASTRQRLGCTPQETALPAMLKVRETLDFVGRNFADHLQPDEVADLFDLGELMGSQVGALSGGQRRRVSVALAFVGKPQLVLLDEPTTGLDVDARRMLWNALLRQHEEGATLVVSSHYLEEIQALAQRVIVLDHGKVLADDTIQGVLDHVGRRVVELRVDADSAAPRSSSVAEAVARVLAATHGDPADAVVDEAAALLRVAVADSDAFVRDLVRSGLPFSGLSVRGASLEEAFLSLTHDASPDPQAYLTPDTNNADMSDTGANS